MKVTVCMGSRCTMMGANQIYDQLEYIANELCGPESELCSSKNLELNISKCLNLCKGENERKAPIVVIDDEIVYNATPQAVSEKVMEALRQDL
ncbi:(2Fe-2S) ferredoxin domain-containing protein [Peptoniphilus duerdenii]|uniref:(2Fe-2S) ferredoxin domain-containing protein n=1 Tax=Peptoniphilus duerdenii TaxID=507750 RepID=UPI0025513156|nr:NAD(P)H-dependent oxidoreductase subunit E [Peptoniphilus duerdenii]MDK8275791.1 NAD(P)H-dependent oxidoreductase subunit E [Peptoniphilus duerdenii]